MTNDRWQRIKALFEAVVERPAAERDAFLASEVGDDDALRREVESLLTSDVADAGFLDRLESPGRAPLDDLLPSAFTSIDDTPPLGRQQRHIGPYEIVALLGEGAMGEVYRARDRKLNRDVAIKVLPPLLAFDPDRLARLRREAQMLAALNHPNVAAIYGFEDSGDRHALVLELVDGPTLADRIALGPLAVSEALTIGQQIAEALEAAHEKGIVHRDLKPANIKIDRSGAVKVLDFGLAKAAVPETARPDLFASHEGLILGTTSYMSPEQARGHSVDKRADIWAFGCVLYEMLTGRLAFPGESASDTIAKVLEREPDWSALPAATPVVIRRLLLRCLAKNPRQRMRDIGDVRGEINAVNDVVPGVPEAGTERAGSTKRRAIWLPWAAMVALVAAVVTWQLRRPVATLDDRLLNSRPQPFTNWEGNEEGAEISPDGKLVAFLSDRDGEWDLWVSQVGTGLYHNLTRDFAPLTASGFIVRKLGFTADSSEVWFNPGDGKQLMVVPWTGGAPRPFLIEGANTPAWSPDDSVVYVYKPKRDDPIFLIDRPGDDARQIFAPGPLKNVNPVWSPDGRWIYFARGSEPQDESEMDVWRLPRSGGLAERVTRQHLAINFLAPLGARTLLYVARAEDRSGPWLWALDVESGVSSRVPSGIDQYTSVSTSRDGRRIVATVNNPSAALWRVPLLDRTAEERDVQPYRLPVPTGMALAPRFGKDALFYLSARGPRDGLWTVRDGKASEVRRLVDGALSEPPAVSQDGLRLAVVVRREGKRYVSVMAADGTGARRLAPSVEIEGAAGQGAVDWSPDGTRLVAGGRDSNGPGLFIIAVDTGVAIKLVDGAYVNPVWSPKGDRIVYAGRSVVGQVQLRAVRPDGSAVDLPHLLLRPGGYRFLPDGSGLVYLPRIQSFDFWLLDFATGQTRQLTRLASQGVLRTFDITPDGTSVVFDRSQQNSNIVLIEVPGG